MELINNGLYNYQADLVSAKVIGQNLTSSKIGIYSVTIPIHEALSGLPKERLLGRKRDKTNIFDTVGDLTSITTQNATINEYTGSLTIADNSLFEVDKTIIKGYRNVLEAMLLGETFSDGTDLIKVLGVGGNVKLTTGMLRNKDWKLVFENDNKLVKAFTGTETANIFLGAYNKDTLSVCLEIEGTSNTEETQVVRYGAVCCGNAMFSEGEDRNTVAIDIDFISDFRTYNQTLEKGFATDNVDLATATAIAKFNVDYIVTNATGADPADYGANGDTAAIINTATGAVEVKTSNGTDAWADITGTFVDGALIFSTQISTSTIAAATDEYNYIVIKTGALAGGTAMGTTVTSPTTYTLGTTYTLPIYVFQFSTGVFAKVTDGTQL